MHESSFNNFLKQGLFQLNDERLIIDLNDQIFTMLGMKKHPRKYHNYFWTPEEPMIDSNHFNIMFSGGFSWMMVRSNPRMYDSGGWAYETEITYSFRKKNLYNLDTTFHDVIEMLISANCDVENRVEKIIKTVKEHQTKSLAVV